MYNYLPLKTIELYEPIAEEFKVSQVARGVAGFLTQYRKVKGRPNKLSDHWDKKRENFIKRHMTQLRKNKERLWVNGLPSRRHLALIMWAYSPTANKL